MSDFTSDSIVNSVIEKFKSRSDFGLQKYGTTLDRDDLSILQWITHAQEELMDGILYLEKIKQELNKQN
jgi:succinate dehydrogenase flavin-adding protein (antitoxin of CptAB toxin-antitoxin module)